MSAFLRQATASQARAIGPFVDDTDFKTLKTALTIANTDIKLVVNGAASVNKNSGGGTHRTNGVYGITFDATDTATVGEIELSCLIATAMVVFHKFFVIEEAVYDRLFAANAIGGTPVFSGSAQTISSTNIRLAAGTTVRPVGGIFTITSAAGTEFSVGSAYDPINLDCTLLPALSLVHTLPCTYTITPLGAVPANDYATAAALALVQGKTDQLTFTDGTKVDSNVLALNNDDQAAANIAKTTLAIGRGTCAGGGSGTSIVTSAFAPAGAAADQFKGRVITFDADTTTAALRGQASNITANTGVASPTFTVVALTTAPVSGDTFSVT